MKHGDFHISSLLNRSIWDACWIWGVYNMTFVKIHAPTYMPMYVDNCGWMIWLFNINAFISPLQASINAGYMPRSITRFQEIQGESKEVQDIHILQLCWWGWNLVHFPRMIEQEYLKCIFLLFSLPLPFLDVSLMVKYVCRFVCVHV